MTKWVFIAALVLSGCGKQHKLQCELDEDGKELCVYELTAKEVRLYKSAPGVEERFDVILDRHPEFKQWNTNSKIREVNGKYYYMRRQD